MKPYYDEDGITIYLADCLEVADVWLSGDVLVTDPPYGTGASTYGRRNLIDTPWAPLAPRSIANDLDTFVRDEVLLLWGDKPPPRRELLLIRLWVVARLYERPRTSTDAQSVLKSRSVTARSPCNDSLRGCWSSSDADADAVLVSLPTRLDSPTGWVR